MSLMPSAQKRLGAQKLGYGWSACRREREGAQHKLTLLVFGISPFPSERGARVRSVVWTSQRAVILMLPSGV